MHPILHGKRLIAFDLDGTLIDSVPDLAAALKRTLGELELAVPDEHQVREWVGNGAPVLVERALTWAAGQPPKAHLQARAFEGFMQHYGAAPNALTRLYPKVKNALEALHQAGFTLVLITNKPERFIAPILEHFGLKDWFALCLGGDTLAEKKPSPMPLLHAADRFGFAPHECLMVGDSRHDIGAGKAAGFATLALPYGYNHGDPIELSQPDVLLPTLGELYEAASA
ncbi:phosphoglycolate phosphatase [Halomonas aquamarina]|uniref:Phosphoglycolate phosphatase n=1 Tax=Vreelandella aquamarina TaxID=77097 RepID=A0ACC5VYP2_9GAMM|nr:phosphoglycolate phosphatase [Halomonas aquamarina]MBZ5489085.1 phosphoglycolate phosphatase [Halomonas aquamarina]